MDFISRDALIGAINAWVLDKARPLGQILVAHGALDPAHHALLDPLVEAHIHQHGGDPQGSLAALSSSEPLRLELARLSDADVQASLVHLAPTRHQEDLNATASQAAGTPTAAGLRFRILRPHARGGLGQVSVALDQELRREVALKEIQDEYADDPQSRARFLREAEVTGGLEHPGVVPVYGLGTYADGRPFYAMRLVKGDSLKEAISRFHRADAPGRDMGERALAFRRLLGRFVDVCNAVAYAHSRGVLHRDLKPGNVMLGPYGETLVVDWGLAKTVGHADGEAASPEGTLRPAVATDSAPTQAGAALGTPPYMAPEQAAGRLDQLGPASDVYSLGATLYALLTGRAPFEQGDVGTVLQKVQKGDFPPPRQVKRAVPAALQAVCLRATALRPEDRYGSARALADDLEHWLADEPVTAYREPGAARAGRWVRRHKPAVAAATAALLVTVLLGGLGAWHLAEQAARQRRGVEAALEEVARLQHQARWAEARVALDQAEGRLERGGPEHLRARLERARRELDLVAALDAIRLKLAVWVEGHFDKAAADREYGQSFQAAGMAAVGGEAAAAWVRGTAVREALVAAMDDWAACAKDKQRRAWLLEVARRADPDPWRDRVRDPAVWDDPAALASLVQGPKVTKNSPQLLALLGLRLLAVRGDAEGLLRRAQEQHPGDFWVNFDLGLALAAGQKPAEAVGYYRAALAVRPGTPAVHNNLGNALYNQGKLEEAVGEYRRAIALDSKFAVARNNLGTALFKQGRRQEAVAEFRRAIALDPKFAGPHFNLGNALYAQGRREAAAAEYRQAIALDSLRASPHINLGNVLRDLGKLDEAIAAYRRAIALDPKAALPHFNLGIALNAQGKLDEAITSYRQALRLQEDYPEAHCNLGQLLQRQGQLAEALAELKRGHELGSRLGTGWMYPSAEWVRQCQRLLDLEERLPAILKGEAQPASAAECLSLARLCAQKKRYAEAARFAAYAFAAEAKLADDLQAGHRYHAACCAARAAAGQGASTAKLDAEGRGRWRQQALDWLRADLAAWGKVVNEGSPPGRAAAEKMLRHWQQDSDLASVRDPASLFRLPREERAAWERLWADVADLLDKAAAQGPNLK
jgi:serine/threonine-protein kinase